MIVLTIDWFGEFGAIEDGALPALPPDLPQGLDGLWIVTHKNLPVRAVYWRGDEVWRDVVVDQHEGEKLAAMP
ncbi:hypothetical protein ACFP2T_13800 [Plantactinospora solaniradicis]|uniref:Uncharacterized protein n=1 Tax=Plantactinospora solaniradicis TaxID=1723736 RepID=A0ABW1K7Z2_9ACTN